MASKELHKFTGLLRKRWYFHCSNNGLWYEKSVRQLFILSVLLPIIANPPNPLFKGGMDGFAVFFERYPIS